MERKSKHRSGIQLIKNDSELLHKLITEVQLVPFWCMISVGDSRLKVLEDGSTSSTPAHSDMNVVTILVGNKSDLKDVRQVTTAEGKSLAETQGLFFIETCQQRYSLDSSNVASAFHTVVKEIYNILSRKVMQSHELNKTDPATLSNGRPVVLDDENHTDGQTSKSRCCSS